MVLAVGPFGLGPLELVVILLVLVMVFGATRITDIGGSLGKGIREFKKNVKDEEEETETSEPPAVTQSAASPVASAEAAANGAETVTAVKCPSCGNLNPAGARHCNQCGTAITASVS